MSGDARAPDKPRAAALPPETPPLLDPASFRNPRLTPNLREMITGFNQGLPDAPIHDLLASPDPAAMYSFLQIGSPIMRDFYPAASPVPHTPAFDHDTHPDRDRASGVRAEMNALFNCSYHPPGVADPARPDDHQEAGAISMMSSPEMRRGSSADVSGVSSSAKDLNTPDPQHLDNQASASQSSSQTPPPVDASSSSPTSPEVTSKVDANGKEVAQVRAQAANSRQPSTTEKKKRPPTRPVPKVASSAATTAAAPSAATAAGAQQVQPSASGSISVSSPEAAAAPPANSISSAASALAAANAMGINPAMPGLMPFPVGMQPGMAPPMLPGPGGMPYQGRPVAFVPAPNGGLIPVDMLAQATALQYGAAAQAAANRLLNPMAGAGGMGQRAMPPPFEPVGGSRKKRRRQMLERSGCTEEQARQNRAHALKRLRQKKSLRTQQNTVRYACRKRIAMVRPRVNGRFATKEEVEESQRQQEE